MSKYSFPKAVNDLADAFGALPGIGPKMASKLAIYSATAGSATAASLETALQAVETQIQICKRCGNLSDENLCGICRDDSRDRGSVMVVETAIELAQIESAGAYNGYYVVLGGLISPVNGISPDDLNIKAIPQVVDEYGSSELIIALASTVEGEATSLYILNFVQKLYPELKITRLARGLPTGVGVEYLDPDTIKGALSGRTIL